MITINNIKYDNVMIKVSFGKYNVMQEWKKRSGNGLFVTFKFDNIILELETTYDEKWLKELKINNKSDISNYISNISYEDEKGWISLITGNYKCFIHKVNGNKFIVELSSEAEECGEYYKILLNEEIEIAF